MNAEQHDPPGRWSLTEDWPRLAPPALGIFALMLFLVLGRPPNDAYGWRTMFDTGHVPLFGICALLMIRIIRVMRGSGEPERADFLIALLAMGVLGLAAEAFQVVQPGRHANFGDAAQNLTGALGFIAIAASLRPGLWRALGPDGPMAARLVLAGAALVLALALMPLFNAAWSYRQRAEQFPVVADLTAGWQKPFLSVGRAALASAPAPLDWREMAGAEVAQVTFLDMPWPGVMVREPFSDWTGYASLRFQAWSELEAPVEVYLLVEDTRRNRAHPDRFNGSFIVVPGLNNFEVSLETIADGPRGRRLDLADISQFGLFSRRPGTSFDLYLSRFWLEGGDERIADVR